MKVVSIFPTYKCNLKCPFCYLRGLTNNNILDINKLNLPEANAINIYGGEVSLLDDKYINDLLDICFLKTESIFIVSNYTFNTIPSWINRVSLGTSIDFNCRPLNKVLNNGRKIFEHFGRKTSILFTDPNNIEHIEQIENIINENWVYSFRIIPCIKTKFNNVKLNFESTEKLIEYFYFNKKYEKYNTDIENIFINPLGNICYIAYDGDIEYFTNKKLKNNSKCLCCEYYNKCFNEHPFYYEDEYDCVGFKKLCQKLF